MSEACAAPTGISMEPAPARLTKDGKGWVRVKQIKIIVATEYRFGVRMNTHELDSLKNLGDLDRIAAGKLVAA